MTSKIVLKAAKEEYERKYEGSNFAPWEALSDGSKNSYINSAQAVFDSAKILLLPADAEPMVGDKAIRGDGSHIEFVGETGVFGKPWKYINTHPPIFTGGKGSKIIARKGYNAVLQEGSDEM